MQTLSAENVAELNLNVLKVDLSKADVAVGVLTATGLQTKLIDAYWPGSTTMQFEILWRNRTYTERQADLAVARDALVTAGFAVSAG